MKKAPRRLDKRDANRDGMSLSQVWNQWTDNLIEWWDYLHHRRVQKGKADASQTPRKVISRVKAAKNILHNARRRHHARPTAHTSYGHSSPAHRQFPESNYPVLQLTLFIIGSLPRLVESRESRRIKRRKRRIAIGNRFHSWFMDFKLHPAIFLSVAALIVAAAALLSVFTVGMSVSYNGYDLGTVSGITTVARTVSQLEKTTQETLHDDSYEIDKSLLTTSIHISPRRLVTAREVFTTSLCRQLNAVTDAYVLYVDGQPIAATTYSGALEELLEQLKLGYTSADTVESYFTEDVEIRREYISNDYVMNLGYIAEILNDTKAGEVTYTVEAGDAPLSIAEKFDISYDDLKSMNSGYNWSVLNVGDVLVISSAVPYLTVVNVEQQRYVQNIPYEIEYTEDSTMYQGDYKVTSPGSYGKADVVANVTLVNGDEITRSVVSTVTLLEPVTEQQLTGTKERPSWFPTGSFRWPCSGYISSYFGYRNTGIRGASTYHQAIDIANSYGTPIYASDGGTVVTAGWVSGLGYTIKIDHGNGYVTSYGHNSSLLVSVGAHVYKGQQIARMGSTGISSGPHCDFRICLNGTYVNPLNYLS